MARHRTYGALQPCAGLWQGRACGGHSPFPPLFPGLYNLLMPRLDRAASRGALIWASNRRGFGCCLVKASTSDWDEGKEEHKEPCFTVAWAPPSQCCGRREGEIYNGHGRCRRCWRLLGPASPTKTMAPRRLGRGETDLSDHVRTPAPHLEQSSSLRFAAGAPPSCQAFTKSRFGHPGWASCRWPPKSPKVPRSDADSACSSP